MKAVQPGTPHLLSSRGRLLLQCPPYTNTPKLLINDIYKMYYLHVLQKPILSTSTVTSTTRFKE